VTKLSALSKTHCPSVQVPDLEVARLFYGEGLGLAADPSRTAAQRGGTHVTWWNIGRQQVSKRMDAVCAGPSMCAHTCAGLHVQPR
jgi:hypothetical protein